MDIQYDSRGRLKCTKPARGLPRASAAPYKEGMPSRAGRRDASASLIEGQASWETAAWQRTAISPEHRRGNPSPLGRTAYSGASKVSTLPRLRDCFLIQAHQPMSIWKSNSKPARLVVCVSSRRGSKPDIIDTRTTTGRCTGPSRLEATTQSEPIDTVQTWTKFVAKSLLAVTVILVAAMVSRVIYVHVAPLAATEAQEESDFHREFVDCREQPRPAKHRAQQREEDATWMVNCLDS